MKIQLTQFDHRKLKEIQDDINHQLSYYYKIKSLHLSFVDFKQHDYDFFHQYQFRIMTYLKEKYNINPNGIAQFTGSSVIYTETVKQMYRDIILL